MHFQRAPLQEEARGGIEEGVHRAQEMLETAVTLPGARSKVRARPRTEGIPNLPRLWSKESVAEVLDVAVDFVGSLILKGELVAVKLGHRTLRVKDDSLRAYMRRIGAT